jgi:hypothetical protein
MALAHIGVHVEYRAVFI